MRAAAVAAALLLATPASATEVVLDGDLALRCVDWARSFEAAELKRTEGLSLSPEEAAAWAKERGSQAIKLCSSIRVACTGRCGACPALVTSAELGLPTGFVESLGLGEPDLRAWGKAQTASAEKVYLRSLRTERLLRNPAASGCSEEPGGIQSEGEWIWCRPAYLDDPIAKYRRLFLRTVGLGAAPVAVLGIVALLLVGKFASRRSTPKA